MRNINITKQRQPSVFNHVFQNHGYMEFLDVKNIILRTMKRNDFKGITLSTNYHNSIPPYNYVDSNGDVLGTFKDVLEIACKHLNITLEFKSPLEINKKSWFSK